MKLKASARTAGSSFAEHAEEHGLRVRHEGVPLHVGVQQAQLVASEVAPPVASATSGGTGGTLSAKGFEHVRRCVHYV